MSANKNRRTLADVPPLTPDAARQVLGILYGDRIRRVVDEAPPLTDEQRGRLAAILRSVPRPLDLGDDVLNLIEEDRQ